MVKTELTCDRYHIPSCFLRPWYKPWKTGSVKLTGQGWQPTVRQSVNNTTITHTSNIYSTELITPNHIQYLAEDSPINRNLDESAAMGSEVLVIVEYFELYLNIDDVALFQVLPSLWDGRTRRRDIDWIRFAEMRCYLTGMWNGVG